MVNISRWWRRAVAGWLAVLLTAAGASGASAQSAQGTSYTLQNAIGVALSNNRELRTARLGLESAGQRVRDIAAFVRPYLLNLFPQLEDVGIDYAWGGTLAVTVNRLPHVGRVQPNVFFGQGYSGHGILIATLAGKVIAEAIAGTASRFDVLADLPIHTFPGGTYLRYPGMVLGMLYYTIRDRI